MDPATQTGRDEEAVRRSPREARGGEVILRTKVARLIFVAGLAGIIILAVIVGDAAAFG